MKGKNMGLDMSLYREVQMKGKMKITDKEVGAVLDENTMRPIAKHEVCYWRKFNALHKYFADNFGEEGNDNCVSMYMDIENIKELLKLVKKIKGEIKTDGDGNITNPDVCEELPTEEGFFFGSTDYDEGYIYQLDETIKQLSEVVSEHKALIKSGVREGDIDYYYRAWY